MLVFVSQSVTKFKTVIVAHAIVAGLGCVLLQEIITLSCAFMLNIEITIDFDERMLSARYEQCLAEAQEGEIVFFY